MRAKKVALLIGGIVLIAGGLWFTLFHRSYTIGKNPKLEDISSVSIGGGGMEYASGWHFGASYSASKDRYTLQHMGWSEEAQEMLDETVEISSYDFHRIVYTLDGLLYTYQKPNTHVMDGSSQSADIYWEKDPGGFYKVQLDTSSEQALLLAFNQVWEANRYKLNEPISVNHLVQFEFSFGPTDYIDGETMYRVAKQADGSVLLEWKFSGQSEEEIQSCVADASFLKQLQIVIEAHGANCWYGFSGNDSDVLDGSAFSLSFATEEGASVSAHGRESYPDGYFDFEQSIDSLFSSYINRK